MTLKLLLLDRSLQINPYQHRPEKKKEARMCPELWMHVAEFVTNTRQKNFL